jgi:Spy/CpxP family protein refolding chaperone
MRSFTQQSLSRITLVVAVAVLALGVTWAVPGIAQDKLPDPPKHKHGGQKDQNKDLVDQIHDLQAQVAKLEAALNQGHQGTPTGTTGMGAKMGKGMKGMEGMEGMNTDDMMKMLQMMGGMKGPGEGMPGMSGREMMGKGMEMMGSMKSMGGMRVASALPAFPGASHVYHIGATGFFLDHPEHIRLDTKQQTELNHTKEKGLLDQATAQRKIDEAEQELWTLTASDQPDAARIEAKVREIEKLRGDQRMAFIRAVGEAAKVLTDEQRHVLLGVVQPTAEKPNPHVGHQPGSDGKSKP